MREHRGWGDDRAVSTTVGYSLALAVSVLLITGLLLAGGTFLEDQREESVRTELTVVGEQLAADIAAADRLAQTTDTERVVITRDLPETVADATYTITVVGGADAHLELRTADPAVEVQVDLQNRTSLFDPQQSVGGGTVRVVFTDTNTDGDPGPDLEVQRG